MSKTIDVDFAIKRLKAKTPINEIGKITIDECIAELEAISKPVIKTWDEEIKEGMFLIAEGCWNAMEMEKEGCSNKACPFEDYCHLLYKKYKTNPIKFYYDKFKKEETE